MSSYPMTIDGELVAGRRSAPVINPATGAAFAESPVADLGDLDRAVAAAQRAQRSWGREPEYRQAALLQGAKLIRDNLDSIAHTLTLEQGKPIRQAQAEIAFSADVFDYYAGLDIQPEVLRSDERTHVEVHRRPLGVVGAITPWNFPIMLACQKIAPALAAGNTVVLKPSPYTPLSTLQIAALLRDAVPPGVLNVVTGGDELGEGLVRHPVPRKISFTGSVATGKRVAALAGQDLKRTTLELGGNDPAIVLPDADPGKVAKRLFWAAFLNSGQVCAAVKRIYAPRSRYADLVAAVAAVAASMRVGDGLLDDTDLGPLNNEPQLTIVTDLVGDAVRNGGRVVTGGGRIDRDGYFFAPTIIADIADGARLVDEEQFGPALPIVAYDDVADAVASANATTYGLGASVWGADGAYAAQIAAELEAGVTWVNTHTALAEWQPFGGTKWSGVGVENGVEGYHSYTDMQVIRSSR